jgi:hypothetical protein
MSKLLAHNNQMLTKEVISFMVMASQGLYNKAFWPFKLPLWGSKLVYSSVTNGVTPIMRKFQAYHNNILITVVISFMVITSGGMYNKAFCALKLSP